MQVNDITGNIPIHNHEGFVSESRELLLLELMLGLELLKLRSLTSPLGKFVI